MKRSLYWVEKLHKVDALSLHSLGEPLLHKDFLGIAKRFSDITFITMSTNALLIDEKMADEIAKIPWSWISISPWKKEAADRAFSLLTQRGIRCTLPPGVTHNFAGTAEGPSYKIFNKCDFLNGGKAVIRHNGDIVSCCITDRSGDEWGTVFQEPEDVKLKAYDLCKSCHHSM